MRPTICQKLLALLKPLIRDDRRDDDRRERADREVAQQHLEHEEDAGHRRVEHRGESGGGAAAEQRRGLLRVDAKQTADPRADDRADVGLGHVVRHASHGENPGELVCAQTVADARNFLDALRRRAVDLKVHEELDCSVRILLQVFRVSVENVDALGVDVDVFEEVVEHKRMVALRMVTWKA